MKKIITYFYSVISILLLVGPHTLFHVCSTEEKTMKCFYSVQAVAVLAVILLVVGILLFKADTAYARISLSVIGIVTAVGIISIPLFLIGGCGMRTMNCRSKTFPAFYLLAALIIIIFVWEILRQVKTNEKTNK